MSDNYQKLRGLLKELFQLDQADLDFGIYRIMNQKRDEIVRFLDNDLLPQVKTAFGQYRSADRAVIETELAKAIEQAQALGVDPDQTNKVKELKARLSETAVDVAALESEVFSHLYNFFRRYYDEGDFLSLRRYKEGVYAIPYEGEEVKLHWANADQYYVKSTETFRDFAFKLDSGKRVRFQLVAASTEQDNNKPANGKDRRFVLSAGQPLAEENGELCVRFEYCPVEGNPKQDDLNREAIETVLAMPGFEEWTAGLASLSPTDKNPNRTALEMHLLQYTARNTFDYFIHKDLGGFLRRELDFYIKNEVMHLDDIENESAPRVEQYLSQIKVIRGIAHKIVRFLEQLENFQKRLWPKRKFVVQTNYCVALDRVPDELYPEIAANEAQRLEWQQLLAIDEIEGDLASPGYTKPLTVAFLKSQPTLLLDTKHFSQEFRDRLVASFGVLDDEIDAWLFRGENFQALAFAQNRFRGRVKCVYIDPPYNTGQDGFLYKDAFKSSTWASMIRGRLQLAHELLAPNGVLFASINEIERSMLEWQLADIFGPANRVEEIIWALDTMSNNSPTYSTNHEYVEAFARSKALVEADRGMFREEKPGYTEVTNLIAALEPAYPSTTEVEAELRKLYQEHKSNHTEDALSQGQTVDDASKSDPWKGLYPYKFVEYRDANGALVNPNQASALGAKLWVWREVEPSMPAGKQSDTTKDPNSDNYRFYRPTHPVTKKPCKPPKRGWAFPERASGDRPSFESYLADNRIVFKEDENSIPQLKYFLHEVSTVVSSSVVRQYSNGEPKLEELFGRKGLIDNPKPPGLIEKFVSQTTDGGDLVLDHFAGSGTTGHSVINVNRADGKRRKCVLVEQGHYFDTALLPRLKKVAFAPDWAGGKPIRTATLQEVQRGPHVIKVIHLESYEDTLNNLQLERTEQQSTFLNADAQLRERYTLSYMLDVETRGSQSLLNVQAFRNPDAYKLRVERNGESQLVNVDLVETFNWLLGLTVKHIDVIRGVRVVEGTDSAGERVLVLWRDLDETDNDALDRWFERQGYSTRDLEYDLVYVNGDNNLENLRRADQTWKVRLIEEEFQRLMFDVRDV